MLTPSVLQDTAHTTAATYLTLDRIHTSTALPKLVRVLVVVYNSLGAVKVVESAHIVGIATSVSLHEHTLTCKYNVQFQNGVCVAVYANNVQCILREEAQIEDGSDKGFHDGNEINMMQGTKMTASSEEEDFGNEPLESDSNSSGAMLIKGDDELVVDVQESKVYIQELGGSYNLLPRIQFSC